MAKIEHFTDLNTWKEAHQLVMTIYTITKKFPDAERFGLTSQMQRAAVSVTSNIAEGFSRSTAKEKMQFYSIAHGSLSELESQLFIVRDLKYLTQDVAVQVSERMAQVGRLLTALRKSATNRF